MPEISQKKLKIIKRRMAEQSPEAIAKELGLPVEDVRRAVREMKGDEASANAGDGDVSPQVMGIMGAIFLLLTVICFGVALQYPFVFDDHHAIEENRYIRDMSNFGGFLSDPKMFSNEPERKMYRPLILISYAVNYAIGENNTVNYRLTNLLIHAINALLVFLIFMKLLKNFPLSAALAGIFTVHTVVSETVVYLSARSTLLAATFIFGSFYAYLRQRDTDNGSFSIALCAVSFFFALMCKENALMLPAILIAADMILSEDFLDAFSEKRWSLWGSLFGIALIFLAFRAVALKLDTVIVVRDDRLFSTQVFTQMGVWIEYVKKLLWPIGLSPQGTMKEVTDFIPKDAGILHTPAAWLFFWIFVAVLVFLGRKNKIFMLGISFTLLILVPETITPLNQVYAERRMYMPLFGMLLAVGGLLNGFKDSLTVKKIAIPAGIIVFLMIPLSISRTHVWGSEKTLWGDSIRKTPNSPESWHGLGYVYGQEKKYYKAIWALNHALALNDRWTASLRLMGGLLLTLKRPAEALPYLEKAMKMEPLAHRGWYNLGLAQAELGKMDAAIESYKKSINLNQFYAAPHNNLGGLFVRKGRLEEAQREFEEAVRLEPGNMEYRKNLQTFMERLPKLREHFNQSPGGETPGSVR